MTATRAERPPAHRVHEIHPWLPRPGRPPTWHELSVGIDITDELAPGPHGEVPIRRYRARSGLRDVAPFVWAHGGGFVVGDLDMPESHAVACAIAHSGREVVTIGYRLVPGLNPWLLARGRPLPGVRFPVPSDDVTAAFVHLATHGDGKPLVLAGASAGACLVSLATLGLIGDGGHVPQRLVLTYGLFHPKLPKMSDELRSRTRHRPVFTSAMVAKATHNYAGEAHRPEAFPGGKDLTGMPPTLMVDADADSLRASGEAFAAELTQHGTPVQRFVVGGSMHAFLNRPATPAFTHGVDTIVHWLDRTEPRR